MPLSPFAEAWFKTGDDLRADQSLKNDHAHQLAQEAIAQAQSGYQNRHLVQQGQQFDQGLALDRQKLASADRHNLAEESLQGQRIDDAYAKAQRVMEDAETNKLNNSFQHYWDSGMEMWQAFSTAAGSSPLSPERIQQAWRKLVDTNMQLAKTANPAKFTVEPNGLHVPIPGLPVSMSAIIPTVKMDPGGISEADVAKIKSPMFSMKIRQMEEKAKAQSDALGIRQQKLEMEKVNSGFTNTLRQARTELANAQKGMIPAKAKLLNAQVDKALQSIENMKDADLNILSQINVREMMAPIRANLMNARINRINGLVTSEANKAAQTAKKNLTILNQAAAQEAMKLDQMTKQSGWNNFDQDQQNDMVLLQHKIVANLKDAAKDAEARYIKYNAIGLGTPTKPDGTPDNEAAAKSHGAADRRVKKLLPGSDPAGKANGFIDAINSGKYDRH